MTKIGEELKGSLRNVYEKLKKSKPTDPDLVMQLPVSPIGWRDIYQLYGVSHIDDKEARKRLAAKDGPATDWDTLKRQIEVPVECLNEAYDRANPRMVGQPRGLSCPCRKCRPWC